MNEIILIKLISGEEIIGAVLSETDTTIVLKDTVTIAYRPAGDGKMSAGFAPHMPYAEDPLTLYKTSVTFTAEVKEDMLGEYKRIFGGIIVPKSTLVGR